MNNYEYIIASLPVLRNSGDDITGFEEIVSFIKEQLNDKDLAVLDFLESGFEDGNLSAVFYSKALSHSNRFIRQYFDFDLHLRNSKVEMINRRLGRIEGKDIVEIENYSESLFQDRIDVALSEFNLLERERKIDSLIWEAVDEITISDIFTLDMILAFIVKLKISERWMKLDEKTGREMFRKLVFDIKETYSI